HIGGLVENGLGARGFGQREERSFHQVALIARRSVSSGYDEWIEVAALADSIAPQWFMVVGAQHSEFTPLGRGERTRRKDRTGIFVARGFTRANCAPGLQIVQGVKDAPADLSIDGASSIGPVFLKGAQRNAEETCRFLGPKQPRRQVGFAA